MSDGALFAGVLVFGVSVLIGYVAGEVAQTWMRKRGGY